MTAPEGGDSAIERAGSGSVLNVAGPSYELANVTFAVLQECEHRRGGFVANDAEQQLMRTARKKLDQIRLSYSEAGGTEGYWRTVQREVLETAMPEYIPAAVEKNRLEKTFYDVWRHGDLLARFLFALLALTVGEIIVQVPFIPIFVKWFPFLLAFLAWFYPELRRASFDYRHSRLLNKLITSSERYQKNARIHYVSDAQLNELFHEADEDEKGEEGAPRLKEEKPPQRTAIEAESGRSER